MFNNVHRPCESNNSDGSPRYNSLKLVEGKLQNRIGINQFVVLLKKRMDLSD